MGLSHFLHLGESMDNKDKAVLLVEEFDKYIRATDNDGGTCFIDEYGYESIDDAADGFLSMIEDDGEGGRKLRATDDVDELMMLMKGYLVAGMPFYSL